MRRYSTRIHLHRGISLIWDGRVTNQHNGSMACATNVDHVNKACNAMAATKVIRQARQSSWLGDWLFRTRGIVPLASGEGDVAERERRWSGRSSSFLTSRPPLKQIATTCF
ncbi:hypothetical protein AJ87_34915 [Rhizobium yanglingense]|nr:hypothetical protein AJ87_34915 [Rhizobium yanglingense]